MNDVTLDAPSASKRQEKTKRTFRDETGEVSARARTDSISGHIEFVSTGETLDFAWDDLSPEVQRAAGLFGIMTSVTNTVGRKDMTDEEMIEAAEARLETIKRGE